MAWARQSSLHVGDRRGSARKPLFYRRVLRGLVVLTVVVVAVTAAALGVVRMLATSSIVRAPARPALVLSSPPERAARVSGTAQRAIVASLALPAPRIAQIPNTVMAMATTETPDEPAVTGTITPGETPTATPATQSFAAKFVSVPAPTPQPATTFVPAPSSPITSTPGRIVSAGVLTLSPPPKDMTSAPLLPRPRPQLASLGPLDNPMRKEEDSIGPRTAIYDITAQAVYLPNGEKLEAHSGLGEFMDDPRHIHRKMRGATPPGAYRLKLREALFHGVRAIRMTPEEDTVMHGRDGILAHSYLLGPNGQSHGCVSFKDYARFLRAFDNGEIERMVVVARLATPPAMYARRHQQMRSASNAPRGMLGVR